MLILRRALHALTVAIAMAGIGVATAKAETDRYLAWHNGSKMEVIIDGSHFEIRYVTPKRSIRKHGVRNGTVLFTGELRGRTVEGEAAVFRRGCDPENYWVSGRYSSSGRSFVLRGDAPKRERGGCEVIDYSSSSSNARLKFTRAGGRPDYEDGDHDDLPGNGDYCGWWAIYACHKSRNAAIRDMNSSGYGGVVDTNDVPNFRNGYYCVADGPTTKSNARRKKNRARRDFDSPYIKKGC